MGGFFLGFIFAETKKIIMIRKQGWTFIPIALINRVLRLWPCYIIVILICANVASYMGDGPKWDGAIEFFGNCSSTWW
jgi:peptidoglycan/LPS O-acetylase OafA/YrhL